MLVQGAAHPEANIIFGASFDDSLDDEIVVTVIATGFDEKKPETVRRTEELSADVDEKLFEKLRALRTKVAQRAGVPPYVVFSNATLADMAARQPKSEYELLGVRGVGEAKARRYGAEFVDCIRAYLEAK